MKLKDLVRAQIEYYFSADNLQKDFFLRRKMDHEGFLPLTFIVKSLRDSEKVEMNEDDQKIRPRMNPQHWPLLESATHTGTENSPTTATGAGAEKSIILPSEQHEKRANVTDSEDLEQEQQQKQLHRNLLRTTGVEQQQLSKENKGQTKEELSSDLSQGSSTSNGRQNESASVSVADSGKEKPKGVQQEEWKEVRTKRSKRSNRNSAYSKQSAGVELDFQFDSEIESGGNAADVGEAASEDRRNCDDLDDALCNKLIIVTQTPPSSSSSGKRGMDARKMDEKLNKEMEHTLRRYEQELWSKKGTPQQNDGNNGQRLTDGTAKERSFEEDKQIGQEEGSLAFNVWTKKAMERAAASASIPKSPVAKREENDKPVKRFYPLSMHERQQPFGKPSKSKESTRQMQVMPIGWVLGVRSKSASINEDAGGPGHPSTSEPSTIKSPPIVGVFPPHPSVSLFQENGFEQRVRSFLF
uniref:HTH La-type RNA-binding domain-containing protein n=1 Tax=Globodera pallida TaxID=36090 RepID=A0A183CJH2_GLOPA